MIELNSLEVDEAMTVDSPHAPVESIDPATTRVGVVGLGAMGSRIADRLLACGWEISVWNRTSFKAKALAEKGARVAETPGDIARSCAVVITMVADPSALWEVAVGPNGIANNLRASSAWIEMSTVGPRTILDIAKILPDESQLLEAPVLGSISEVEDGSLAIFVGGSPRLAERLKPVLSYLGTPEYVGERGTGASAKLVANFALVGTIGVLGEALALAKALALPESATFSALQAGPLAAQAERRRVAVAKGDYPKRFALRLARKDARLIKQTAHERNVALPIADSIADWFDAATKAGLDEADYSALLGYMLARVSVSPLGCMDTDDSAAASDEEVS